MDAVAKDVEDFIYASVRSQHAWQCRCAVSVAVPAGADPHSIRTRGDVFSEDAPERHDLDVGCAARMEPPMLPADRRFQLSPSLLAAVTESLRIIEHAAHVYSCAQPHARGHAAVPGAATADAANAAPFSLDDHVSASAAVGAVSVSELAFSFNGGKDSTALLHLLRLAAHRAARRARRATADGSSNEPVPGADASASLSGLRVCYFATRDEFPAVLGFMADTADAFGVRIERMGAFKDGLATLRGEGVRAVLIGTRRTDPDGRSLTPFAPCSPDWPPLMRVCPILHWSYANVWEWLRLGLPYCALYDQGFTSLGQTHNSVRNPALRLAGEPERYLPAYCLEDETLERAGRGPSSSPGAATTRASTPRAALIGIINADGVGVLPLTAAINSLRTAAPASMHSLQLLLVWPGGEPGWLTQHAAGYQLVVVVAEAPLSADWLCAALHCRITASQEAESCYMFACEPSNGGSRFTVAATRGATPAHEFCANVWRQAAAFAR